MLVSFRGTKNMKSNTYVIAGAGILVIIIAIVVIAGSHTGSVVTSTNPVVSNDTKTIQIVALKIFGGAWYPRLEENTSRC